MGCWHSAPQQVYARLTSARFPGYSLICTPISVRVAPYKSSSPCSPVVYTGQCHYRTVGKRCQCRHRCDTEHLWTSLPAFNDLAAIKPHGEP
jgi:hypothetical protein